VSISEPVAGKSHLRKKCVREKTCRHLVADNGCVTGPGAAPEQSNQREPAPVHAIVSMCFMAKSWTVDELIRVRADNGGWRVWRVVGVFLGATNQEDVIELETLDRDRNTEGRMCVPRELLNASMGASSC